MRITPFCAVHAEAAAALHARCFVRGWPAEDFRTYAGSGPYSGVAALRNGLLAGFAIIRLAADEAEILTLASDPESRRQGIGLRMLQRVVSELPAYGVRTIFLEVGAGNAAALGLYRNAGFTAAGLRPGYYVMETMREDAVIMRKSLTES